MYRKPHDKTSYKSVKKLDNDKQKVVQKQQNKKFAAKPAPNMKNPPKISVRQRNAPSNNKSVPQKVQDLQKIVDKIQKTKGNEQIQQLLLKQIQGIKSQLKQIKNQIGMKSSHYTNQQNNEDHQLTNQYQPQQQQQQQQNIINFTKSANNGQQLRQLPTFNNKHNNNSSNLNIESHVHQSQSIQSRPKISSNFNRHQQQKKVLIDVGKIQPYMRQFKLQTQSKQPQPFYYAYHKKSSKPVIIKYCQQNKNMDFLIGVYEKLWKNIVKAKSICINKIYDLNQPLATNIIVLQQNKCGLQGIQIPPFKIAQQIIKALQFFHQCGFLYRNIHPDHVMMNYQNNIVLVDLKKVKRFVDIKGKVLEVKANQEEIDQFVSNSRIRNALEGRKDDLECLGYLTLYMLEGKLPWNIDNMIQVRSKLTLNQIFGKYPGLLKYMIEVQKLPTHQMPNYAMLNDFFN